jgi:hypothetical protein
MTYYERIKNMSIEEMTEFLDALANCDGCKCSDCVCYNRKKHLCPANYTREYLESEVEE